MKLTDLKKLESVPELRIPFGFQLGFKNVLFDLHLDDREVDLQNHFDKLGFDFTIPSFHDQEDETTPFDNGESIYLYQVINNSFGIPTLSHNSVDRNSARYLLTYDNCLFEVEFNYFVDHSMRLNSSSVTGIGRKGSVKDNLNKLIHILKSEINKLKKSNFIDTISESATYFENPFHSYFEQGLKQLDAIIFHDKLLEEIDENEMEIQSDADDYYEEEYDETVHYQKILKLEERQKGLRNVSENFKHLSRMAVFFLFVASLEGLLNLIYEVYLFKELREDERIKAFVRRAQIDVKLRTMPVYCSCFKGRLIEPDETFKKVQAIFNLRNDLVHANMTSAMTAKQYEIDNMVFYSYENKKDKYYLPQAARSLTIENLQFVCETVEKMVEQIMASMKPRYKREFEQVLHRDGFYARLIDGEYVIEVDEK